MNEDWENVSKETSPLLPVRHGTEVKVVCRRKYVNFGGRDAVCRDGGLIGALGEPYCRRTGEIEY